MDIFTFLFFEDDNKSKNKRKSSETFRKNTPNFIVKGLIHGKTTKQSLTVHFLFVALFVITSFPLLVLKPIAITV